MEKINTQVKPLVAAIDESFNFISDNTQYDNMVLEQNSNWQDIYNLKNDLATAVIEFMTQCTSIITNTEIINGINLLPQVEKLHYEQAVNNLFTDMHNFSIDVSNLDKTIYDEFGMPTKSGLVTSLNEIEEYNRMYWSYSNLSTDLVALVTQPMALITLTAKRGIDCLKEHTSRVEQPITAVTQ